MNLSEAKKIIQSQCNCPFCEQYFLKRMSKSIAQSMSAELGYTVDEERVYERRDTCITKLT